MHYTYANTVNKITWRFIIDVKKALAQSKRMQHFPNFQKMQIFCILTGIPCQDTFYVTQTQNAQIYRYHRICSSPLCVLYTKEEFNTSSKVFSSFYFPNYLELALPYIPVILRQHFIMSAIPHPSLFERSQIFFILMPQLGMCRGTMVGVTYFSHKLESAYYIIFWFNLPSRYLVIQN